MSNNEQKFTSGSGVTRTIPQEKWESKFRAAAEEYDKKAEETAKDLPDGKLTTTMLNFLAAQEKNSGSKDRGK